MIILSPYSRSLRNGKKNPKNYPYWKEVINAFHVRHLDIIQIGVINEEPLVQDFRSNLTYDEIFKLVNECSFWMSVDNFLPHLAHHTKKPGVVLWGISDPNIFGYPDNLNILKDRSYLRPDQFELWESRDYQEDAFVPASNVIDQIDLFVRC